MKNARMVTVYEIAERVGVSASTVSRALNRRGLVRPELERRIEAVAEAMGYAPDLVARGLRAKHMQWLGLVVDQIDQPWASQISGAISRAAAAAGWSIVLMTSASDRRAVKDSIGRLASLRVCATLRIESPVAPVLDLRSPRHPLITIGFGSPGCYPNRVGSDEEAGIYCATTHLITLGHRQIGHLAGRPSWAGTSEQIAGFQHAIREAGYLVDLDLVAQGDWSLESGYHQAKRLLAFGATALIAASDQQAVGAYDAARELERQVPHDIGIIGHDDSVICTSVRPRLTTVALPLQEMGEAAVRLALECIEGDHRELPSKTVAPRLVVRESSGQLPAPPSEADRR